MREDDTPGSDSSLASLAGGGAAVGAGFGGLIGAVIGWIMGAQVTAVPQIGPVVGQWVLPSTLVGLLAGVVIGALIGALAAIASVGQRPARSRTRAVESDPVESQESPAEAEHVAQLAAEEEAITETPVTPLQPRGMAAAKGAQPEPQFIAVPRRRPKVRTLKVTSETPPAEAAPAEGENDGPLHASLSSGEAPVQDAQAESEATMDRPERSEEQLGRNPNTFTGTEDAVDPDTGAVGTAGTPVTTGYGVSGSTVGVGTRKRRKREESGDFRGATPDSASYDMGGRATRDKGALQGAEREPSVAERNSDAGRVEASVPRGTEGQDIYEQSEGYVENLERAPGPPPATNVTPGVNESAGTDIPGTEDPRGLGDNTDDPL